MPIKSNQNTKLEGLYLIPKQRKGFYVLPHNSLNIEKTIRTVPANQQMIIILC